MGESRHGEPPSTHLYKHHSSPAIHLDHRQLPPAPRLPLRQIPTPLPVITTTDHHHPAYTYLVRPPLHPARQARPASGAHQPISAAVSPAYPTVIVSSHFQHPAWERDATASHVKTDFTPSATTAHAHLDGNNSTSNGVQRSALSMTTNGHPAMASRRDDRGPAFPRSQRPSIVSQHSNSVPSTPLQLARQYESQSRSPSPNGGLGSHSPRSVSSEANGPMPTLRAPGTSRCKYETNAAFGRRRIPYVSSEILERPPEEPKKTLDPHEDEKLSGDMRELYDRLLPGAESTERRKAFVRKVENILHTEFPGNEFKVHVFGSSGNLLYTSESDVDICIQTPMKRLEEMHILAEALDKHGMEKVVCIPQARVRIVKVWDPELKLASDMNVNNTLALENTRMIKTYVQIDERVRPLAMIVKHWTKRRILNDAAFGGTISSYTWICLILNFLQTRDPPIIPSLHKLPYRKIDEATGKPSESEFADDLDKLVGFGKKNKESLGQLLFQFFRVYGYEMDYENMVISVREGRLLTREEKTWHLAALKKEARHRLCVEEPFNTDRNLGNSADDFAWRGIHLELRRAFDLLADHGQLDKACEQFEFPNEEKTVFKKPTSTVKAVLQTPSTRGGRGGLGYRGGRGNFNQKNNYNSQRRASSGASFNTSRGPFLNNTPLQGMEYGMPPRKINDSLQLHDQLFNQYITLEMQSNSLRAQLVAQQHAQQAHNAQQAQMHAHAVAQAQAQAAHAHAQSQGQGQSRGQSNINGSPQKSPYTNSPSSPQLSEMGMQANPLHQQYLYQYPTFYDPAQQSTLTSQDAPRTNPSSPSLNNSVLRRSVHRNSNASETGSHRSQSQPARAGQQPTFVPSYAPMPQYLDPHFGGYHIAHTTHEVPSALSAPEPVYAPMPAVTTESAVSSAISSDHSTPKEYLGYYFPEQPQPRGQVQEYVAEQPQPRHQLQEYTVPNIPSYNELAQRRRRVSPDITQPLLNTALRRVSRSPSPLGTHSRSYSTSVAPIASSTAHHKERVEATRAVDDMGPVIVNGSYPTQPREPRSHSETLDTFPSLEPSDLPALGIYSEGHSPEHYGFSPHEQHQQLLHEEMQRYNASSVMHTGFHGGHRNEVSPVDPHSLARVPSAGSQPYRTIGENWGSTEPGKNENGGQSPAIATTQPQAPQWQPISYTNSLKRLDTKNTSRAPPQEIKSAGLPLLSPVFETRTPSPTASRQDAHKGVNGVKSQPKENQNQSQHRRASHTAGSVISVKEHAKDSGRSGHQKGTTQAGDKGGKPNASSNNSPSSGFQGNKKSKRKKAGNKSGEAKGGDISSTAERKGG